MEILNKINNIHQSNVILSATIFQSSNFTALSGTEKKLYERWYFLQQNFSFDHKLTLPIPCISESFIEVKVKLY